MKGIVQKIGTRRLCAGFFGVYVLGMLWLLFFRRTPGGMGYWQWVHSSYNLHPFYTIRQMIGLMGHPSLMVFAAANLVGNIVLFIPLGLLPELWKPQQSFGIFFLTVGGSILLVELLQLFTTLGSADIDDWIFNVLGASLGFVLWKLIRRKWPVT